MATEKRLIDMDDLLREVDRYFFLSADEVRRFVAHAPVVDAVEVVRCKDCRWLGELMGKDSGKPCGYGYCKNPIGIMGIAYNESYCSYGERKDND